MKLSRQCPKCKGTDIYTDAQKTKHSDSIFVPTSKVSWAYLSLDVYICTNCGYAEQYVNDYHMKDPKMMEKVKKNWKKW